MHNLKKNSRQRTGVFDLNPRGLFFALVMLVVLVVAVGVPYYMARTESWGHEFYLEFTGRQVAYHVEDALERGTVEKIEIGRGDDDALTMNVFYEDATLNDSVKVASYGNTFDAEVRFHDAQSSSHFTVLAWDEGTRSHRTKSQAVMCHLSYCLERSSH